MGQETTGIGPKIGATETSFNIIEHLAASQGMGVTELAKTLSVSKSTVHNHIQTLRHLGYVIKDGDDYRLSLRFLGLGDQARKRHGLYHVAKPVADELVEAVGERVQIMVEEEGVGIYIYQSFADKAVRTDSHVGTVVSLHSTAVGKSYLAHLSDEELSAQLDQIDLREETQYTHTSVDALKADLEEIAEQGYAFNEEERIIGMRAVGAPILSDDDRPLGCISVSGPTTRMNGDWYEKEIPELVTQSARVIGIKATYS